MCLCLCGPMWMLVRKRPWVFVCVCCVCVLWAPCVDFAMVVPIVDASAIDLV